MKPFNLKHLILFGMLALTCGRYENNNPFDPLYSSSNYKFKVNWSMFPDTGKINTEYVIGCTTSVGRDTFLSFSAIIPDSGYLNTINVSKLKYDTLKVSFDKEFKGEMEFQAKQPNGATFSDAHFLRVRNQFKPRLILTSDSITTILGTKAFIVFVKDTLSSSFTLYSQGKSESTIDSSRYSSMESDSIVQCLLKTATNGGIPDTMRVWMRNSAGLISDTFSIRIFIIPYVPLIRNLYLPDTMRYMERPRFAITVDSNVSLFKVIVKSRDGRYNDTSQVYQNKTIAFNDILMNAPISDVTDTGKVYWSVSVLDVERSTTSNQVGDSMYVDPALPLLAFDAPMLELFPSDTAYTIEVRNMKNTALKYFWAIGGRTDTLDTTTTTDPLVKEFFKSELQTTIAVRGMNNFGFWGPTAVLAVTVTKSTYLLRIDEKRFPMNIKARDTARFDVVLDNNEQFKLKKGMYFWKIDSLDHTVEVDSGPQLHSFTRYFPDSGLFRINVIGRDISGDSSNWIRKLVVVHRYAPICHFDQPYDTVTIPMDKPDTLRLDYYDSALDTAGRVDSVFWKVDGGNVFEPGRFRDPYYIFTNGNIGSVGSHKILAYVKDNDGFPSPVDSMTLVVISSLPYIGVPISDGNILVGEKISWRANFLVSSGQKPILRYYWRVNDSLQTNSTNIFTRSFDAVGTNEIIVNCVNTAFGISPMDTFLVNVYSDKKPVVMIVKPDTVWIMDDTTYSIKATSLKPGVPIVRYDVSWDANDTYHHYDTLSVFKHSYSAPGPHLFKVVAVDNEMQSSDTLLETVWVRKGAPVCDTLIPDNTALFVNKLQTFTIWSYDSNGTIDSVKIFWNDGDSTIPDNRQLTVAKTTFSHKFLLDDTGIVTLKAIAYDNDGFWSDTMRYLTRVRLGKPVIRKVAKDSVITINVKKRYSISALDSAGQVDSFFISFDNGVHYLAAKDSMCDTTFFTPGKRIIKAYVKNDRGLTSDVFRDSIEVLSNSSTITGITIALNKSKDSIFISDQTKFIVAGHDGIGHIKMVAFAWKGNTQFNDSITAVNDSATITHSFNLSDTLITGILIRLINDRLQVRDSAYPIRIRLGRPVIDSIAPQTTIVNDTTLFKIFARDTNGTVANFIINWGDGSPLWRKGAGEAIKHKYAISQSGMKNVKAVVQDDDSLYSDTASFNVNVRLCKPWVNKISRNDTMCWTDTVPSDDDTMVCPFRSGSTITTLAVNAGDSNGTVKKVYWQINGSTLATDKPIVDVTTLSKDVVYKLKVWCMDDDSILSDTLRFNVLPHTPPPQINDMNFDKGYLLWNGKDPVDGDQTQYKVVFKKMGADTIARTEDNGCPTCTVVGFKTGFASGHIVSSNFDWGLQVNQVLSPGGYLWKIYMRNSLGQISRCIGTPSLTF